MSDMDHDLNDSLDDIFGPAATTPRAPRMPELVAEIEKRYLQPCHKCGGSGAFYGRNGRNLGPCFACKGAGGKTYKTPPAVRAAARVNREDARDRKAQTFRDENPDVCAYLDAEALRGNEFCSSLVAAIGKYGALTDRQLAAAVSGMQRRAERIAQRKAEDAERAATAPKLQGIVDAFGIAAKSFKQPILRLEHFTISAAKPGSQNPGWLYVKAGETYLGKIGPDARFERRRECTPQHVAQLEQAAVDPHAAALAYARATKNCAICGKHLDNPESVERGIGPVCAKKWGW